MKIALRFWLKKNGEKFWDFWLCLGCHATTLFPDRFQGAGAGTGDLNSMTDTYA